MFLVILIFNIKNGLIIHVHLLVTKMLVAFTPIYVRPSLIGGSIALWLFVTQTFTGILLSLMYTWMFDVGQPGVVLMWWETYYGSFLIRIHAEIANILFFMLYVHLLIKIWTNAYQAEADHTWISGIVILLFSYIVGITGAIMPCSILSEVTATVIGSAINSLAFVKFDFLETLLIPGMGLTDDTMVRVFFVHGLLPIVILLIIADHIGNLHSTEYTDEDEMENIFIMRYEYWDSFAWLEINYWYEVLMGLFILRLIGEHFWPSSQVVTYSATNFEYWPIIENIDFVLAVPHWYLRPLMGSLVTIPHHYLGFFFVIFFFYFLITLPWTSDNKSITSPASTSDKVRLVLPSDMNIINIYIFSLFIMLLIFTTIIVPTGRYFIALGGSEFLTYALWCIMGCLIFFFKWGNYWLQKFSGYNTMGRKLWKKLKKYINKC